MNWFETNREQLWTISILIAFIIFFTFILIPYIMTTVCGAQLNCMDNAATSAMVNHSIQTI